MVEYIVGGIVTIFICVLLIQQPAQTVMHHSITRSEGIINTACEQAKQEGYFTTEIIEKMKSEFASAGIDPEEISIEVTTTPKYRTDEYDSRELIEYKIGIPLKNIIAGNEFVGISDKDNNMMKYFKGALGSEKVVM